MRRIKLNRQAAKYAKSTDRHNGSQSLLGVQSVLGGVVILLLLFNACSTAPAATPDPLAGVAEIKLLATVFLSPTPGDAERQATQAAVALLPTPVVATPVPSSTPYIGIFLGESGNTGAAQPIFDGARFVTPQVVDIAATPAVACAIAPDTRYGGAWANEPAVTAALGCAGEDAARYDGSTQLFERGVMLFIPSGELWAIAPGVPTGRYWYVPQAPPTVVSNISAPEGLRVPQLGFGAFWEGVAGVRDGLGFARTEETGTQIVVQRFTGGTLLLDVSVGQTFAILGSGGGGTAYGPY
jgi:hypothetical protein